MSEGWTGGNFAQVKYELNNFLEAMEQIRRNYFNSLISFNVRLKRTWASEKAVEFNAKLKALAQLNETIRANTIEIMRKAELAAFKMADANGVDFTYTPYYEIIDTNYMPLLEEKDGIKGMNIPLAKEGLDSFIAACGTVKSDLSSVPFNIELLDPNGDIKAAYKEIINKLINTISEEIDAVNNDMQTAFENEELQLELGKRQATDILGGISGFDEEFQEIEKARMAHIYN